MTKALNNTGNPLSEQPAELSVILREDGKDTVIGGEKIADEILIDLKNEVAK